MEKKLSIIIPVWNSEKYLSNTIQSIVNQSMFNKIELIIVNDGSTDNSLKIIGKYEKYSNMKLINLTENEGISYSRNLGIKFASGEYITFVDSDDELKKDYLEIIFRYLDFTNLDILTFDLDIIGMKNLYPQNYYIRDKIIGEGIVKGIDFFYKSVEKDVFRASVCMGVYNRRFLRQYNIEFPVGIIYEDNLFTLKALLEAKKVKYINKILYFRRIREDSIVTSKITYKKIQSLIYIYEKQKEVLNKYYVNRNIYKQHLIAFLDRIFRESVNFPEEELDLKYFVYKEIREITGESKLCISDLIVIGKFEINEKEKENIVNDIVYRKHKILESIWRNKNYNLVILGDKIYSYRILKFYENELGEAVCNISLLEDIEEIVEEKNNIYIISNFSKQEYMYNRILKKGINYNKIIKIYKNEYMPIF